MTERSDSSNNLQLDAKNKEERILLQQHQDIPNNVRQRQWSGKPTGVSKSKLLVLNDPESEGGDRDELFDVAGDDDAEEEMDEKNKGYRRILRRDWSRQWSRRVSQKTIVTETMTENVFSLIFTAPVQSSAFWLGLFVAFFQIMMPSLALLDLIIFSDDQNPLQVPNSVSVQVRIIGAMALVLAVSQYWDFMEAIDKLEHGPPPRSQSTPAGATCWKFYLAYTLQFIMGTLFIITIFTLVVQSTTVVGMFLNFAALEFITTVDDVAFALGKRGYFTSSIKKACEEVNDMTVLRKKGGRCSRRIQLIVIACSLQGLFALIWYQEERGQFDCRRIEVQFGDGFVTLLPVFSGIYTYTKEFHNGRPVYIDKRGRAVFRYSRISAML